MACLDSPLERASANVNLASCELVYTFTLNLVSDPDTNQTISEILVGAIHELPLLEFQFTPNPGKSPGTNLPLIN
jgi:hypothetical protein